MSSQAKPRGKLFQGTPLAGRSHNRCYVVYALKGFWIAAGMSGHGFKLAPAVGEMMAALITDSTPPVSPASFRLARFAGRPAGGTFVSSYLG